jgi:hypothetical protein
VSVHLTVLLDVNLAHSLRYHRDHHDTMTAAFGGFARVRKTESFWQQWNAPGSMLW